jgi:hypothetical protein
LRHELLAPALGASSWRQLLAPAGWPDKVRTILRAAVHGSTATQWRLASDEEIASRAALEAQGIDIGDAGRAAFKDAVRVVIEQGYADLPEAVLRAARSSPA